MDSTFPRLNACAVYFLFALATVGEGGKLLVIPQDGSHWLSMRSVVEKLSERGHEIVVVVPDVNLLFKESKYYTLITHAVPYTRDELAHRFRLFGNQPFDEVSLPSMVVGAYKVMMFLVELFFMNCESLLRNREIMQSLKENAFDVLLTDPAMPCGVILAEYLSIPSVYFFRGFPKLEYAITKCPDPVSYVPRCYSTFTDHMTFTQRLFNFLISFSETALFKILWITQIPKRDCFSCELLKREVHLPALYRNGSVWLLRYDFVFEYPRPVMPNMVLIGGINCEEGKLLSRELEDLEDLNGPGQPRSQNVLMKQVNVPMGDH
ncbi:LOW QUALITY PROTEIN: UDP-glucuronosyltransferase 1-6-like [Sphaerodactylus townsendi]|uniref:LOW QUALITY PROTEIN: UDP-glucuronosyltransferase 1-6-like n=1 Tax=Sphaerodactylus townsendi TaxID=933632 RepID=UPI0020266D22|nr:LOW QUALITY PROTEIN: UDP-glucuronosyltransferase 1-6-like [Sphaerodactylus townsendi]